MLPRRQNYCFAPGCRTGYVHVKGSKKPSLFGVPKDAASKKQWERNLHRADKALDDTSPVCDLHFQPKYVLRDYVHIIYVTGLRVTITSVLEMLSYLTGKVAFNYIMTSKTSQDPLENLFGIIRQSSSSNDHPTPTQFLLTITCLSFYGLVKTVSQGNCDQGELASLLEINVATDTLPQDDSVGSASTVNEPTVPAPIDHNQHIARSDSRLIFNVAGYIARKCVIKTNCEVCITLLTMPAPGDFQLTRLTTFRDKGGLLYPSSHLYSFVSKLENMFTECFSCYKLHSDSILDVLTIVKEKFSQEVGCAQHAPGLSKDVISFYIVTRFCERH